MSVTVLPDHEHRASASHGGPVISQLLLIPSYMNCQNVGQGLKCRTVLASAMVTCMPACHSTGDAAKHVYSGKKAPAKQQKIT